VQFTSPVMGRYGQYTALIPPGAIQGESREIAVRNPALCGLMDELDHLFGSPAFQIGDGLLVRDSLPSAVRDSKSPLSGPAFPIFGRFARFGSLLVTPVPGGLAAS
jgi:hypothetical protein